MRTRFVEVTQSVGGGFNHGKFMVAEFEAEEWRRRSELDLAILGADLPLLLRCGWAPGRHVLVFDLQTGEGALFLPGGLPRADLDKHRVWVCPMFEPFLEYAYERARADGDGWVDALPALVELPGAPREMQGYRRKGPDERSEP